MLRASMRSRWPIVIFGALGLACDRGLDDSAREREPAADGAESGGESERIEKATRAYARVKDDVERLERKTALHPTDSSLRFELGRLLVIGGVEDRGLAELAAALELDRSNVAAAALLGKVLLRRNEADEAARVLATVEAVAGAPDLAVLESAILLHRDPTAVEPAMEILRRGLRSDPRHVEVNYELGVLALRTGDSKTAERCLALVVERDPNHLGGRFNLARLLRKLGRSAEADEHQRVHKRLAILETLGQLSDPDSVTAYLGVAEVLQSGGDVEGALEEFRRGIERHPEAPLVRVRRALLFAQVGRIDDCRKEFETALRALPDDPIVLNQFAWYLATKGASNDDRRRAVKLAERAVAATRRQDANVLDTLAEARAAAGDLAGARAALDEAIARKPDDVVLVRRRAELAERAAVGR